MISILILPEPGSINDIARLYNTNRLLHTQKDWQGKAKYAERPIQKLIDGKPILEGTHAYEQMNLHFLHRSLHQANEACNKLWSTVELYYHAKNDKLLCGLFSQNFLASSTIPNLHYANCSALISLMSLFGLCSFVRRKPSLEFFNLIRTSDKFFAQSRNDFVKSLVGHASKGWHWQVLETYSGLMNRGVDMPQIDLKSSRELLTSRNRHHYDVLGHTTMVDVSGVDEYFRFLPIVVDSISRAIKSLNVVLGDLPNQSDKRFHKLVKVIPRLLAKYGKEA